ncbi:MAG: ribonuclease R [Ruminococcaceae bacterium]|nr:ribonuclease R [Oscillospiraceae bacterium]
MQQLVGILLQDGSNGLLKLDAFDAVLGREIHIPANALNGAPFGMKVVAELLSPPTETRMARAKIIEVLGDPARPDVAITAIIRRYGIAERFPEPVLTETEEFPLNPEPDTVAAELAAGRSDLRDWNCFTIDGADAKDLDDAVSIERLSGGRVRLGVHIADVSHYVKEGSALDIEAQKRGNSVYLVDRVVPMLPPRLSNGLCSLNPGQDRLALSVIMDFDAEGVVGKGEILRSVIHSKARTTYEEVRETLETGKGLADRYPGFLEDLQTMRTLAEKLSALRCARGALEFEFPETRIELDENGKPLSIEPYPLSFANELIESFMIAANEFVARELQIHQLPGVYRVHELPDKEKLERFTNLAKTQGIKLRFRGAPRPIDLSQALEQIKHEPAAHTLSQLLLRSLAKARYSPENLGHFGLASENYLHFTSPIRRYPDLFVHRVVTGFLTRDVHRKRWEAVSEDVSENSSATERAADQAERDTIEQKATEYMAERIGEEFSGFVAGFNNAGIFVQLENTVEGMIPYRDFDQYYIYDENKLTASTRDGLSSFHLGDPVRVQVARADTITRQIDFALLEAPAINSHPRVPMAVGGRSGRGKGKPSDKKKGGKSAASGKRAVYPSISAKGTTDDRKNSRNKGKTRKQDRRKK